MTVAVKPAADPKTLGVVDDLVRRARAAMAAFADADQAVSVAHRGRYVGDLIAARFSLLGRAAELLEGFEEERLDVVRLQTAGVGAFNVHQEITGGPTEISESSTKFGIDGGGGLALKLGRLEAFIEGRVQNVYTEQGMIDSKTIRAIPVTFGILF